MPHNNSLFETAHSPGGRSSCRAGRPPTPSAPARFSFGWGTALSILALAAATLFIVLAPPTAICQIRAADSDETEAPDSEDDEELPTIDKMELPSFQRLMKGPAVDWIVMHNKKVIEAEPVFPRPGALEEIDQKVRRSMRKAGDRPEGDDAKQRRMALYYLPVTLLEGEERDYKLHVKFIKEVIYYEDLMLKRVDQLLDDRKVRQAYELLTALEERQKSWPGIASRKDRLLSTEAAVRVEERQPQHALALLEALLERTPAFPGLEAQFGLALDQLNSAAIEAGDPRSARYFLRRVARRYPNHKVVKDWTARLMQRTRELIDKANAADRAGERAGALDFAEEAARTWPDLPELLPVYNRLASRLQRLKVGVVDLPRPGTETDPVVLSAAGHRRRQLTETPLFEPARLENKTVRYDTKFFNEWEPTELGHSVLFRLRPWRTPGESQPLLTAASLSAALRRRIDPQSGQYDARFAAAVDALEVPSPFELVVRFRQVPLRPESLFAFVCQPASASDSSELDDDPARSSGEAPSTLTYPFELQSSDDQRAVYRRAIAEPSGAGDRHIAEVVETRYASYDKAIQGLLRGEVSFLPRVPASSVRALAARSEFFTQQHALPTTHVLQFNPKSRALSARTLRRALVYALDRKQILEEVFLHEPAGSLGRLTSAPFATTSYAYDGTVKPHKFDPALAFSLAKSAEKELGAKLPALRLVCSSAPDVQSAARRIIGQWQAVGIDAKLAVADAATLSAGSSDDWDILYRAETLAEPLVELWQFLALTRSTETGALGYLPTWLRQELLDLDRVGDWQTAGKLLNRLHKQFWAEVHLIPLWEINDVLVYRQNVRGVPLRPVKSYQRIERWKIEPWFSREPPS